jgi:hypothetical protein
LAAQRTRRARLRGSVLVKNLQGFRGQLAALEALLPRLGGQLLHFLFRVEAKVIWFHRSRVPMFVFHCLTNLGTCRRGKWRHPGMLSLVFRPVALLQCGSTSSALVHTATES